MKTLPSDRFGAWEMRKSGFSQHGLKVADMIKFIMKMQGCDRKEAKAHVKQMMADECWYDIAGKYKVVKLELDRSSSIIGNGYPFESITQLSIRILKDNDHLCDWRDFQAIKNDICSPTREAIEIYPSEDRLHDTDNIFHLWVFPEGAGFPLGWQVRDVLDTSEVNPSQRRIVEMDKDIKGLQT